MRMLFLTLLLLADTIECALGGVGNETVSHATTQMAITADEALRIALQERNTEHAKCDHSRCEECTADSKCGWCETTGQCHAGDSLGPDPGMLEMPCSIWSFGRCAGAACRSLQTCGDCTGDPDCGWCESNCKCMEKHSSDPTSPAFGECDHGWYHKAGWAKKQCPLNSDSVCLSTYLLNANADIESASEAAQDPPLPYRVSGKLVLQGIDPSLIDNVDSKNAIKAGVATFLGLSPDYVNVPPAGEQSAAGKTADAPPALLLEHREKKGKRGFFGSLVKRLAKGAKRVFGIAAKKAPPKPKKVVFAEITFEVKIATVDEQHSIEAKLSNIQKDSANNLKDSLVASGLKEASSASSIQVVNIVKSVKPGSTPLQAVVPPVALPSGVNMLRNQK